MNLRLPTTPSFEIMNKLRQRRSPPDVSKAGHQSVVLPTITFLSIIAGSLLLFLLLVAAAGLAAARWPGPDSTTSTWTNALMRLFWTFYGGQQRIHWNSISILLFLRRRLIRSTRQASLNLLETLA